MAREYFCAYHSLIESLKPFTDAECGRILRAALEYSATGETEELRGNERFIWPTIKQQIDRDSSAYNALCDANRENGKKGGRPLKPGAFPKNQKKRTVFPKTQKSQEEEKEEEEEKDEGKEKGEGSPPTPPRGAPPAKSRFVPPSVDEVRAYCRERGNRVDPDRFVDFYTSKGWKVGREPMKDWQAAVRTWEKRDEAERPKTALPDYDSMEDLPC